MKKTLLLSLLFALMAVTLPACDPDDDYYYDDYYAPFLGTWTQDNGASQFIFYDNGTGVYSDMYGSTYFSWDARGSYLTVYPDGDWDEWDYQWSIYGDMLVLYDLDTFQTLNYFAY